MKTEPKLGSHGADRARRTPQRAQLPPAPRRRRGGRGRLGDRRRGQALPRHARRLLGAELRPPPSRPDPRGEGPARPGHTHLARVPPRPVRPVLRAARRALRHGHGPRDELRRRGRRDRAQDGPPMGLRREGRGPRAARRSSCATATSTGARSTIVAFSSDPSATRRVRPVHAGFRVDPLRRRRARSPRRSRTPTSSRSSSSRSRARRAS